MSGVPNKPIRRPSIVRGEAKRPHPVTATVTEVIVEVDPIRRRVIGDALLRLLNSTGTPGEGS